jgi:hypothetical protein
MRKRALTLSLAFGLAGLAMLLEALCMSFVGFWPSGEPLKIMNFVGAGLLLWGNLFALFQLKGARGATSDSLLGSLVLALTLFGAGFVGVAAFLVRFGFFNLLLETAASGVLLLRDIAYLQRHRSSPFERTALFVDSSFLALFGLLAAIEAGWIPNFLGVEHLRFEAFADGVQFTCLTFNAALTSSAAWMYLRGPHR